MTGPSWVEHLAAAQAMGLTPRDAYETFDDPLLVLRRATKERIEALQRDIDSLATIPGES